VYRIKNDAIIAMKVLLHSQQIWILEHTKWMLTLQINCTW